MKDKIMNFPLIRFIINLRICQWAANNPVLSRFCNYEVISYLVCGVLTTIVSYVSYFLVRIFSFFVDTAFMEITVSLLCWNEPAMKLLSNVFVLLINYIGSKLLVFKKRS